MEQGRIKLAYILIGALIISGIVVWGIAYLKRTKYETADWKTYQGNGYLFKYPKDWLEKPNRLANSSPSFESPDLQRNEDTDSLEKGSFVLVYIESTDKTLDQIEQEARNYQPPPGTDVPSNLEVKKIKLGKTEALKDLSTYMGARALAYTFVNKGQKYVFSCNYPGEDTAGYFRCDKILSTFRLTEKSGAKSSK